MGSFVRTISSLAVAALVAGCMGTPAGDLVDADTPGPLALQGVLSRATGCETSGGLSLISSVLNDGTVMGLFGERVGPFEIADIREATGDMVIGRLFVPMAGPGKTTGIWHMYTRCQDDGTGQPLGMGWVGVKIEQPDFDGSTGIDHHFFLADLSFSNGSLVDWIQPVTSAEVNQLDLSRSDITWPSLVQMHAWFHDVAHGTFEYWSLQELPQARPSQSIRLWMLVHEGGIDPTDPHSVNTHGFSDTVRQDEDSGNGEVKGRYYPVVFDMRHEARPGESVVRYPAESVGQFRHIEDHREEGAVQPSAGPFWGPGNNEAGIYWAGYDQTFSAGPTFDQWFDVTWIH